MDGKWTLPLAPTICPAGNNAAVDKFFEIFPEFRKPSDNEFTIEQVRGLTSELIRKHHYCPATWTSRAYNLLRLGYPDLAVGDAYKAILLLEFYNSPGDHINSAVHKELRRQTKQSIALQNNGHILMADQQTRMKYYYDYTKHRATMILAQALFLANCYIECFEFLKGCPPMQLASEKFCKLKDLSERAQLIEDISRVQDGDYVTRTDHDSQETRRSGTILPQVYPWSGPYVHRSKSILSATRTRISVNSNKKCYLCPSGIVDKLASINDVEREAKTIGIKASTDCAPGALLFIDSTFLSGTDKHEDSCSCCRGQFATKVLRTHEATCCDAVFCGKDCHQLAEENYHFPACKRPHDLPPRLQLQLNQPNVSSDTSAWNDLLHRLIAHLENKPEIHPLRSGTIGSMIPAYRNTSQVRFSWLNDIRRPIAMLVALRVDIFKDHAWDTWVIQTVQARLRNNVRSYHDSFGRYHVAANLSYMFFNHSCDPNIDIIEHWSGSSQLSAVASKPIKAHEELFITYLNKEELELPYVERQALLKDWTGGECQCQRCREERLELQDSDALDPKLVDLPPHPDDPNDQDSAEHDCASVLTNRYAYDETLIENHPAMKALKRRKPVWEQHAAPLDYEDDAGFEESPLRKKARKSPSRVV